MGEPRLYRIAPDSDQFDEWSRYYPGVTAAGEQVLVVQDSPLVCAHRFDGTGRYLDRAFRTTDWADALSWARELELTPATIRVRQFSTFPDTGPLLAIRDQPSWWEDGDLGSAADRERLFCWWRNLGAFVLVWAGQEYTLDGSGQRFQ